MQEVRDLFYAECTGHVFRSLTDEECDRLARNWEVREVAGEPQLVATPTNARNVATLESKRAARAFQKAAETEAYEALVFKHKPLSIYDLVLGNGKPAYQCSVGYIRRTSHALAAACEGLADNDVLGEKRSREEIETLMVGRSRACA
jgi:hypothetical protein